jgi:hypothetical protein
VFNKVLTPIWRDCRSASLEPCDGRESHRAPFIGKLTALQPTFWMPTKKSGLDEARVAATYVGFALRLKALSVG